MADTRLSRIEQKIAQLEAKRSVARQRLQNEERRKRTRQAMLIGQFVVGQCQKPGDDREKFVNVVSVTRLTFEAPNATAVIRRSG
jgi:hypothetical protein